MATDETPMENTTMHFISMTNVTMPTHLPLLGVVAQPNTALLSLILTFSTFLIAYFLKNFRNSKFLGRSVGFQLKYYATMHCNYSRNEFFIEYISKGVK